MKVEVWWDGRPNRFEAAQLLELASLGISGARLMSNSESLKDRAGRIVRPNFGASLKWNEADAAAFLLAAQDAGLDVAITLWPQARQMHEFDELAAYVRVLQKRTGVARVEFDVEGFGWYKGLSSAALQKAGEELRRALDSAGVVGELGATTYAGAANVCMASLPWVDVWTLQAYSQYRVDNRAYDVGGRYGPVAMQKHSWERFRAHAPKAARLELGLAAYRQTFPNLSAERAMKMAFDASQPLTNRVCYWSAEWLKKRETAAIVKQMATGRR